MNNKQSAVGALLISVGLAAGLSGCNRSAAPAAESAAAGASGASAPRAPQTVSVLAAQQRDVPVTVEAAGTVVSLESVDLRPQISGVVAEVLVREGQFVKKGQPLFRLDDRADRANLEKAKAQLLRDQASMNDLDRQWKRSRDLVAQNFIAQSAADTVLANLEAQRAAVAADVAAVRAAEVALSYSTLNAPSSGRVGAINIFAGTLVQPSGAVLLNISQIDPIGVQFSVPEAQLSALLRATESRSSEARAEGKSEGKPGGKPQGKPDAQAAAGKADDKPARAPKDKAPEAAQAGMAKPGNSAATVAISIPGNERGRAGAAEALQGKVIFVDNAVDTTTGSIRVKASVANSAQTLWPGQYVSARMTTRVMAGAVVVPQAALIIRGNERSVYVVKADGTVDMRSVQARLPSGEFIVVEGVQPGEKVVVEGKQNLRPGTPVKETPYTPARRGGGSGGPGAAGGAASAPAGGASNAGGTSAATSAAPLPVKEVT